MSPRLTSLLTPLRRTLSTRAWRSLVPEGKALIGGEWKAGSGSHMFPVFSPAKEEQIAEVPCASSGEDLDASIEAAAEAQPAWAALTVGARARVLEQWASKLEENTPLLAQLITAENGKVDSDARGEISSAIQQLRWYANEARATYGQVIPSTNVPGRRLMVVHQPIGVVAMITPWNFPLSMMTRKVGAALAAGCAVVLKPADETPLTALAAAFLATSEAGLDPRLLSILTSPREDADAVGKVFCSHPLIRLVGFTGSTNVGKKLYAAAAMHMKRVQLELGGNAPFIIFESADLDLAVSQLIASKFRCSGQTCVCANRILVQESIYETFVDMLTTAVGGLELGKHQGPLINKIALDKVALMVGAAVREGAVAAIGGKRASVDGRGHFYSPTVLINVAPNMSCGREEIFGPVAPIIKFGTEAEAVALANSTPSGLAGYVFSREVGQCWRVAEAMEAGLVGVNAGVVSTPEAPFGGVKHSGIGHEGGPGALKEFMNTKCMCWAGLD
ncbi:succinate semialdehyde dehydrogenase [Echinococcus multilocularis]|uniref:Succinate-semialdehyde dehydrogenase, mitochondrial n=2 Tax=Echinococcus multilocularis TaxID=6211 RepID=A0A068XTC5_ECHMU|nr:succinate semialdehyde dehydrogenase [Echinococcus multilocularis]